MATDVSKMTDQEIVKAAMKMQADKKARAEYQKEWRKKNAERLAKQRKTKKAQRDEIQERAAKILAAKKKKAKKARKK